MVLEQSARRELLISLLTTHLRCGTGALLLAQILEVRRAACSFASPSHSHAPLTHTPLSLTRPSHSHAPLIHTPLSRTRLS